MTLRAIHFPEFEEFRDKAMPGSFHVEYRKAATYFWYCCPCGCGSIARLTVGLRHKPEANPSWRWNGSLSEPTLTPSVHHIGHWHGWLRDGYWSAA